MKTSEFAGAEAAGVELGREDNHSKVYSKRKIILLRIKLVLVQQLSTSASRVTSLSPHVPQLCYMGSPQPCIPQLSHTRSCVALLPLPELHPGHPAGFQHPTELGEGSIGEGQARAPDRASEMKELHPHIITPE